MNQCHQKRQEKHEQQLSCYDFAKLRTAKSHFANHAILCLVSLQIRIQPEIGEARREGEEHNADQSTDDENNAIGLFVIQPVYD